MLGVALVPGVGAGARIEARVAVAGGLAVLHQPVVLDEREHAVLACVEGLEAVEQVAIALEHVDVVLGRVPDLEVADHDPVRPVGPDADVLGGLDRRGIAGLPRDPRRSRRRRAETPDPSIWRLQRMHGPRSGIPCRSSRGGFGGSVSPGARPSTAIRFWSLGQ